MRKYCIAIVAGLAATALAPSASAQQTEGRSSTMCPEVAETARERACQMAEVQHTEAQLAEAWRRVFAQFGGSSNATGRSLLNAQRAWITFKDRACALYFLPGNSSLEWSNGQRCKINVINDRMEQLQRLENDFPGQD